MEVFHFRCAHLKVLSFFEFVAWDAMLLSMHLVSQCKYACRHQDRIFTGYADAVDANDLIQHGNSFLKEFYPRLDYIKSCWLLDDPISGPPLSDP